jgi:hypothetical protein
MRITHLVRKESFMKRLLVSLFGGLYAFLAGWSVTSAAEVPDASASSAPALAAYGDRLVISWAGDEGTVAHHVWYSLFNGYVFTPQADIPGALTTTAPAVAAVGNALYVATTPPDTDDKIYLYASTGAGFGAGTPLCDAETCARTRAAPALVSDGGTLFAAWTAPDGAIMTASRSSGGWVIDPAPIPNAVTSPTTGPTLTLFQHRLRLAWVKPSGEAVAVSAGTIVPSVSELSQPSIAWSAPIEIAAQTKVAPSLGVFTVGDSTPGAASELVESLFLAWTDADSTVEFARFNPLTGTWARTASPSPVPAGTLTVQAPALASFTFRTPDDAYIRSNVVGVTGKKTPHRVDIFAKPIGSVSP